MTEVFITSCIHYSILYRISTSLEDVEMVITSNDLLDYLTADETRIKTL